jgi:hypothetical protein
MLLQHVECPEHGTRVTVEGFAPSGDPVLSEPCCDKLTEAIRRALS